MDDFVGVAMWIFRIHVCDASVIRPKLLISVIAGKKLWSCRYHFMSSNFLDVLFSWRKEM